MSCAVGGRGRYAGCQREHVMMGPSTLQAVLERGEDSRYQFAGLNRQDDGRLNQLTSSAANQRVRLTLNPTSHNILSL